MCGFTCIQCVKKVCIHLSHDTLRINKLFQTQCAINVYILYSDVALFPLSNKNLLCVIYLNNNFACKCRLLNVKIKM